jgi:hypothetical protein
MNIDQISSEWEKDSKIDVSKLDLESIKTPELHHKYYKLFLSDRLVFNKLNSDLTKLKRDKFDFYTKGPHEDTPKEWKLPASGRVLKAEAQHVVDSDPDVIELTLKIAVRREKIDYLKSIIDTINNRSYHITNAINFIKWSQGQI